MLFEFECGDTGRWFIAPHRAVGDFLSMRSAGRGDLAVLPTKDDPLLHELWGLTKNTAVAQGIGDGPLGRATQRALSAVLDPDEDGSRYVVSGLPRCPGNGAEPVNWRSTEPSEFVEVEVRMATHENWDRLSASAKAALLDEALRSALNL